ncbi:MAG TPA: hypothetical protein VH142_27915 [Polyangiaceae bacterium]|jgi:hypothetical protein|nr:hypothetical protein [Polyangiaceae bacterium]
MSSALVDPTDILALVIMMIFSLQRLEIKSTEGRAFPAVPLPAFERWRDLAVRAKNIAIVACILKFVLNWSWFFGFRSRVAPGVLRAGGLIMFLSWIGVLSYSLWLSSTARNQSRRFGIVVGRRLVASRPDD